MAKHQYNDGYVGKSGQVYGYKPKGPPPGSTMPEVADWQQKYLDAIKNQQMPFDQARLLAQQAQQYAQQQAALAAQQRQLQALMDPSIGADQRNRALSQSLGRGPSQSLYGYGYTNNRG